MNATRFCAVTQAKNRWDRSLHVSGKLPTYASPKPTLTLTSHLVQNVGSGERWVGSLAETYNDPAFFAIESRKRAVEYINADDVIVFFFISEWKEGEKVICYL